LIQVASKPSGTVQQLQSLVMTLRLVVRRIAESSASLLELTDPVTYYYK
jgi:hypothetical protein